MSLINQNFLKIYISEVFIKQTVSSISVHSISTVTYQVNEYVLLTLYLSIKNDWTAVIKWEFYLIDNLKINILIDINVMRSEDINILINCWVIIIDSCNNVKIIIFIIISSDKLKKDKLILTNCCIIISLCKQTMMSVTE